MKRNLLIVTLAIAVVLLPSLMTGCNSELPGDAVAKVGDVYISAREFDDAVAQEGQYYGISKDSPPEIYRDFQRWVLGNLVASELAHLEAAALAIEASDEEVQERLDEYVTYYFEGDQAQLVDQLAAEGMSLEDLKTDIRKGIITDKVQDEVLKDITDVPDEDVAAYYQENSADYYVEASRRLRHILIVPIAGSAPVESAESTSPACAERLSAGKEPTNAGQASFSFIFHHFPLLNFPAWTMTYFTPRSLNMAIDFSEGNSCMVLLTSQ